jgi:uncharacterized membrane protein
MNLKQSLQTPLLRPLSKGGLIFLFVIAALGFADAAYLTIEHYMNSIPPCSIGSCETVLTSQYASVLGLPVSLFGAIFYLLILVLLKMYVDSKSATAINVAATLSMLGAIISIVLIALMVFVINAICIYCMVSDILTIILCVAFWFILKKARSTNEL